MRAGRRWAFTILEIMMAIGIFGLVVLGIYQVWMAILKGSKAGLNAAAQAQRARVSIKTIEDALLTAQLFSVNKDYYSFVADTSGEKSGSLTFVARLPSTFPGVGRYGDHIVRRVSFFTDAEGNLVMTQVPVMVSRDKDIEPYSLRLATNVTLLMFEFWDEQKKEYVTEWLGARTNLLPRLVRVALGLGSAGNNSQTPQDLVTCTVAMPGTAVRPEWQRGGMGPGQPGMPGAPGAPGVPPGQPGVPGAPALFPGQQGNFPTRPGYPSQGIRPGEIQRF